MTILELEKKYNISEIDMLAVNELKYLNFDLYVLEKSNVIQQISEVTSYLFDKYGREFVENLTNTVEFQEIINYKEGN